MEELTYRQVGDYLLPNLTLPEERRPIGHWGWQHREYLKQANPMLLNDLILTGKLWTYLADLNEQAQERLERIIAQLKAAEGVTEELKARDQIAWVKAMNSIRSRAEEVICRELVFTEKEWL